MDLLKLKLKQNFKGAVMLKDWMGCPDGRNYMIIAGNITVHQNKDLVGFEASNREANFVVIVHGEKNQMGIFGCQIRGVYDGEFVTPTTYQVT